jgi:capsid protein
MKQDFITKALAVVSPKAAMSRMISQERLRNFGRFDSALESTKRGISRNISGAEDTAGTAERYKLIRAARDLADNFPPVRSLLLKFATYVAGRLSYQARTGDKDVDEQVERYWRNWCKSCDFLRRHDFVTLLQLAVMAILRDGDCGFIIVRDKGELKLQAVEADRIGSPYNRLIDSDTYIGGINLDEYGRPSSYQIFVRTINNQYVSPTDIPAAGDVQKRSPRRSVRRVRSSRSIAHLHECGLAIRLRIRRRQERPDGAHGSRDGGAHLCTLAQVAGVTVP